MVHLDSLILALSRSKINSHSSLAHVIISKWTSHRVRLILAESKREAGKGSGFYFLPYVKL